MISGDILGGRARLQPDKTALVYVPNGERFTYRELDSRARKCAQLLTSYSLKKGDRFGILAQNCVEYLDAFFAAGKSGLIFVPLNYRLTAHELAYIVRDSGIKVLFYESQYAEVAAELAKSCDIHATLRLEDEYSEKTKALDSAAWNDACCDPEDTWSLLYTSGTTGRPKGVIIPHRMIAFNAYNTAVSWQLRDDDIAPIITPLCHAGGLNVFLTPLFLLGGTIVLHRGFDASEVWRTAQQERCTVMMAVPTIFKMLMEAPEFSTADLSSFRWLISGGAPLPVYIIEAYQRRGITFKQGYGLTEVGVNCFAMTAEDSQRKLGSIGKPMLCTEAKLIESEGRSIPENEIGELCLRGPHVCKGYWNNLEATRAALDRDGWWHTGDTARRDSEGFYYIAGRTKDMFISGGVNVYPAEIEAELLMHASVQDAAVVGVNDRKWGEVGVAFVVLRTGHHASADDLTAFLSQRIAKFKIPREFVFVSALPRTPYGKVVKRELQEQYRREHSDSAANA